MVKTSAVGNHIPCHSQDKLGRCGQVCGSWKTDETIPDLVEDENTGFELLVYPNPFRNEFHIRIESTSDERIDLRMLDVSGKVVYQQNGISISQDVSMGNSLAKGVYFVDVTQGDSHKVIRVLKGN